MQLIYLLIDCVPVTEDNVTSQKARYKTIPATFFS